MNQYKIETLDNVLAGLFCLPVTILLNGMVLANGRFVIFTHQNYKYKMVLEGIETKRKTKLELPFPFDYCLSTTGTSYKLVFDYRLQSLFCDDPSIKSIYNWIHKPAKSKYLNEKVELVFEKASTP